MNKLQMELARTKGAKLAEMEQLAKVAQDESRDFTPEEQAKWDALDAECARLTQQIERISAVERHKATMQLHGIAPVAESQNVQEPNFASPSQVQVVTTPRNAHKLKCFTDKAGWAAAYKQGRILQALAGNPTAMQWCRDNNLQPHMVYTEGSNTGGGYLVIPEFDNDVIRLSLQYGVFERYARSTPMSSETLARPRKTGSLTMYAVGESEAITESTGSWDQVSLVAKKWGFLTRITNELAEDVVISLMDDLAQDVAEASATKKDECGFRGTGISTHQGIHGVTSRLTTVNGVDAGGGLSLGTDSVMSGLTLADHNDLVGRLPDYAGIAPVWFCSKFYYHTVMEARMMAAGGNTISNIEQGGNRRTFLGYPVQFTEVMPKADASSQIVCLLGDLRKAAMFGDRRATTIAFSDSAVIGGQSVFERDQRAIRWTERWDINVHDVGTATVAGPVVGLITAAS